MKSIRIKSALFSIILVSAIFSLVADNASANPGWIIVSSPSLGATYYESELMGITWSRSFDSGEYVQIEIYRGGYYYSTITSNTTNDGYYQWTIPEGYGTNSYTYQIRVTSTTDPLSDDFGDPFYIYAKSITVTFPVYGDTLYPDESCTISWDTQNAGSYVLIELYRSGAYVSTIASSASNWGGYYWTVPSSLTKSSNYQIKVTSIEYNVYDFSDYFSINPRSITMTSPSVGDTLYKRETYTIVWTSESAGDYVNIYYTSGNDLWYAIEYSVSNTDSYSWTIPNYLSTGSNYQVKVVSASYSSVYDVSSFTLDERYIEISSPSYSSEWYPNATYSILWSTKNAGTKVDIKLYKNDVYCASIASNIDNAGIYSWTIGDLFAPDPTYQIEIRSKTITSVYDLSDAFSIGDRVITIISPADGEVFYKGETVNIQWTSENAGDYLSIELYKDGAKYTTIDAYAPNQGSYSWQVPSDLPSGSTYQIRILSSLYENAQGLNAGYVTIEDTFVQKISSPLVFIFLIIAILVILYVVYVKFLKKRIKQHKEEEQEQAPIDQPIAPIESRPVSPDEYENIWEKK